MGSIKNQTEDDYIDEMSEHRKYMGLTTTSQSVREQICKTASLLYLNASGEMKDIALAHMEEMNLRNSMTVRYGLNVDYAELSPSCEDPQHLSMLRNC